MMQLRILSPGESNITASLNQEILDQVYVQLFRTGESLPPGEIKTITLRHAFDTVQGLLQRLQTEPTVRMDRDSGPTLPTGALQYMRDFYSDALGLSDAENGRIWRNTGVVDRVIPELGVSIPMQPRDILFCARSSVFDVQRLAEGQGEMGEGERMKVAAMREGTLRMGLKVVVAVVLRLSLSQEE
jgi:hypothetical protein